MGQGRIAELPNRAVVAVGGPEAERFLNDIVTNELAAIPDAGAAYGGLLTPQGKILFDFIVFRDRNRFLFDLPTDSRDDFVKRLGFYRLRAEVNIDDISGDHRVAVAWGSSAPPRFDGILAADPRLAALGYRLIVAGDASLAFADYQLDDASSYTAHRIALGVPEGGVDFAYGEVFPHDADMDALGGIAFDKGCYVGQEVVSRMEHRGTARRRFVHVRSASPLPPAGAEIVSSGKPIGRIASSARGAGLALVRLDRAGQAREAGSSLLARGMPVELQIPRWANFDWPSKDGRN